jgi:hypothetical protein
MAYILAFVRSSPHDACILRLICRSQLLVFCNLRSWRAFSISPAPLLAQEAQEPKPFLCRRCTGA